MAKKARGEERLKFDVAPYQEAFAVIGRAAYGIPASFVAVFWIDGKHEVILHTPATGKGSKRARELRLFKDAINAMQEKMKSHRKGNLFTRRVLTKAEQFVPRVIK